MNDLNSFLTIIKKLKGDLAYFALLCYGAFSATKSFTDDRLRFLSIILIMGLGALFFGLLKTNEYNKFSAPYNRREKSRFSKLKNDFNLRAKKITT